MLWSALSLHLFTRLACRNKVQICLFDVNFLKNVLNRERGKGTNHRWGPQWIFTKWAHPCYLDQETGIAGIPEAPSCSPFSHHDFLIFNSLIWSGFCTKLQNCCIDPINNQSSEWAEPFPHAQEQMLLFLRRLLSWVLGSQMQLKL